MYIFINNLNVAAKKSLLKILFLIVRGFREKEKEVEFAKYLIT
jgi:hypothetical protein